MPGTWTRYSNWRELQTTASSEKLACFRALRYGNWSLAFPTRILSTQHSRMPVPSGSRFNGPERGAWYAAFTRETSELEVAYHKGRELQEIRWQEKETFTYVDFLADFRGAFHDLRNDARFRTCLDANSYRASQHLAGELLAGGSAGVVYPSVRHKGGTCLVCFRPALVNNVRKGSSISIGFENAFATPEIREIK